MMNHLGLHFFSVCDGHGQNGHFVSHFIKQFLPLFIEKQFQKDKNFGLNDKLKQFYENVPEHLHRAFHLTHEELKKQKFDTHLR